MIRARLLLTSLLILCGFVACHDTTQSSTADLAMPIADFSNTADLTAPDMLVLNEVDLCTLNDNEWRIGSSQMGQVNWEAPISKCRIWMRYIVFYHTLTDSTLPPAEQLAKLEESGKQLYVDRYNSSDPNPTVKGEDPHSDHFDSQGKEIFRVFTWLIYPDGTREQILNDGIVNDGAPNGRFDLKRRYAGWHTPNIWHRYRSVGVAFVGDYTTIDPSAAQLQSAADLLKYYQLKVVDPVTGFSGILNKGNVKSGHDLDPMNMGPGNWWTTKGMDDLTGRERLLKLAGY